MILNRIRVLLLEKGSWSVLNWYHLWIFDALLLKYYHKMTSQYKHSNTCLHKKDTLSLYSRFSSYRSPNDNGIPATYIYSDNLGAPIICTFSLSSPSTYLHWMVPTLIQSFNWNAPLCLDYWSFRAKNSTNHTAFELATVC